VYLYSNVLVLKSIDKSSKYFISADKVAWIIMLPDLVCSFLIDGIQNYIIVIATLFCHFEWGKYQKLPMHYIEIQ